MSGVQATMRLDRPGFRLQGDLETPPTGVTALFGRSGSGKTSLLRCLAGLEPAMTGRITVGDICWHDSATGCFLPTHKRALGYVFQDAALFPHLSVADNLAYARRRAGSERPGPRADEVTERLGIAHLLERSPAHLSGGERQRVAVARALLTRPRLLLMDEPLASLDQAGKAEILPYLEQLHTWLAVPVIYVSHALEEVARLADRLVLMEDGRCHAHGPLVEMLARLDLPLSHGEAAGAVVDTVVSEVDEAYAVTYLDSPAGRITLPGHTLAPGQRTRVRIAARDVSLMLAPPGATSVLNRFPARIVELAEDGPAQALVKLDAHGVVLLARITRKSRDQLGLHPDMAVHALVKSVALVG
ncbi:MAG TPA: molybdenum ABC transporter ATP-binding protein [Gammaproteobacteria bacterium]|nr:molybdenum ABC transporter ATP-binding protein [Gammaproteobacteria bacterium]